MTLHNAQIVSLQQQTQQMNAAVTAALAVVRVQVEKRREKDDVIACLRSELEAGEQLEHVPVDEEAAFLQGSDASDLISDEGGSVMVEELKGDEGGSVVVEELMSEGGNDAVEAVGGEA